jgi:uncharacterized protein YyaL (SSP411 family)
MKRTNRLIGERSPYLLKHAHNPVDWYPWGDEAFERAGRESKPVFLSIGYSACHWCTVMEQESFEDRDVAKLLNENFISIKVDREERPDVDAIYMRACQMLTGSGGWPLTIVMTPERMPFFAATYIPKLNSHGRVGLMELIPRIRDMWASRRSDLVASSREISQLLGRRPITPPGMQLDDTDLALGFEALKSSFDENFGGFGPAPKFPSPSNIYFLLRYHRRFGDPAALAMVETTLDRLRRGGIHDHVGGGFHRYSIDSAWRVPHFEKMLSDQALVSMAYTEAWQVTGREWMRDVARQSLDYAIRDLAAPGGGFNCSEGADSEGGEGAYYVWTMRELRRTLDEEDLRLLAQVFGIREEGNTGGEFVLKGGPANILHMDVPLEELAAKIAIDPGEFMGRVYGAMRKLYAARQARPRPARDDKVLADWNGLMIAALSVAARAFGERRYLDVARAAADCVLKKMRDDEGRLFHSLRDEQEPVPAFADDYVFVIWGLIELYQACFDAGLLERALELNGRLMNEYWGDAVGIFTTRSDSQDLPARVAESYDGATPSANSVHIRNLIMLSRITGETAYEHQARAIMHAFASQVRVAPAAHTFFLSALDCSMGPYLDVIVAGERTSSDVGRMLATLRRPYNPDMLVLMRDEGEGAEGIERISRFVGQCDSLDGRATAYVCRGRSCMPPTANPDEALAALSAKG